MVPFSVVSKTSSYLILSIKLFHIFSIDSFSPYRIVDDCGAAFAMGAIGGGLFSFVKGWRNAPVVSWRPSIISCVNIYWFLPIFSSKTSVPLPNINPYYVMVEQIFREESVGKWFVMVEPFSCDLNHSCLVYMFSLHFSGFFFAIFDKSTAAISCM